MTYRKSDVRFHSDGYRDAHAAVNVKVHGYPTPDLVRRVLADNGLSTRQDPSVIVDAIDAANEAHDGYGPYYFACEMGWEDAGQYAEEIFGYGYGVQGEGRSGGWCVVTYNDRPTFDREDVEGWDAIMLAKWARFERWCRDSAEDVPYRMVDSFLTNDVKAEADTEGLAMEGVGL